MNIIDTVINGIQNENYDGIEEFISIYKIDLLQISENLSYYHLRTFNDKSKTQLPYLKKHNDELKALNYDYIPEDKKPKKRIKKTHKREEFKQHEIPLSTLKLEEELRIVFLNYISSVLKKTITENNIYLFTFEQTPLDKFYIEVIIPITKSLNKFTPHKTTKTANQDIALKDIKLDFEKLLMLNTTVLKQPIDNDPKKYKENFNINMYLEVNNELFADEQFEQELVAIRDRWLELIDNKRSPQKRKNLIIDKFINALDMCNIYEDKKQKTKYNKIK